MGRQPPKRSSSAKHAPKPVDAVQMLKADHKQVQDMFEQWRSAPGSEQGRLAKQLFAELEIHTKLEEELFYPALRSTLAGADYDVEGGDGLDVVDTDEDAGFGDASLNGMEAEEEEETDEALITVAYEEHQAMKELIEQLRTLDPKGADFRDVLSELEEAVLAHVAEEEDVLLPMASAELDIRALGARMQRRREELSSPRAA
ncbi:hemerythrin domain-containing protein [Nitrospira moscoviensis]|uniref:Putative Hemerythrin HHE cation binding domain protein n=1 Tax=Nitrospira moscoviensis TaxID=42253 RepID=A0A0K2GDI0_NITMO|nr:hemerythrin domain-containing protein [Nitrospira moscoviensis]ALA59008.1 putative Hemerythrin HHE cation binding domain protein [Nitrospira moscoviensis]